MSPRPHLPQPYRRLGWTYVGLGAVFALLAVPWLLQWGLGGLPFGALGAGCVALGVYYLRVGPAVQLANAAIDAIARGQLVEAESLLDLIPERVRKGSIARVLHLRRAVIALRRGETKAAIDHATRAIAIPGNVFTATYAAVHRAHAQGLRALAFASLGDDAATRADVAALRASPLAPPETLATASLAEAVLLSRGEDRTALAALLARDRRLLHEFTAPRERALARALERLAKARGASVYREPAKRDEPERGNEPPLADWIAAVAPAAAAFAPPAGASRTSTQPVGLEATPSPESVARVEAAQVTKPLRRRGWRVLALWALLVVMFVAIWQFLSVPAGAPSATPAPSGSSDLGLIYVGFLVPVLFFGFLAWAVLRERRMTARLLEASRVFALGDPRLAETMYASMTNRWGLVSGNARLQLAAIAERAGRFEDALKHAEAGIARIAHYKAAGSDLLMPELLARRAYALAALGRDTDATTQIGMLTSKYPGFAWLSRAQMRVRLMQAVRRGEIDKARALARERTPDLPLDVRDEMLADLLVATADRAPAELVRLDDELRDDADLAAWIGGAAPAVLAEFRPLAAAAQRSR